MRGAFIRGDGLEIPNNVTLLGRRLLLNMALRNTDSQLFIGLCQADYLDDLDLADIQEPGIGVNGYQRFEITRDDLGWPGLGSVNGEAYLETDWFTWAAVGGDFDAAIQRPFLTVFDTETSGGVIALGGAFPEELVITPTTLEADRKFKYRLYSR